MLNLPKNIYVMSLVMSLSFATTAMMVLIAGLLGTTIAPRPELATLPVAMMIVGAASAAIPAALIMQRIGRKAGMAVGISIALSGAVLAFFAVQQESFSLFVLASAMMGFNAAFTQQGRFIILENAKNQQQQADGLTLALIANLFAAIIGPMLGAFGKDLLPSSSSYAGSFILLSVLLILALLVLTNYKSLPQKLISQPESQRPLLSIIRQPMFILAAGSAAIGYGIMSFVMTATPVSMHEINGHSLNHTTLVIQSHLIAMFLPSLLSGYLLKRGLTTSLIFSGLALYMLVSVIAFNGQDVLHYWWALLLLGLGWNLLFMTSTALLPQTYHDNERFKAQAINDFFVFSVQAIAAFSAGWVLFNLGWETIIGIALAVTIVWFALVTLLNRKI